MTVEEKKNEVEAYCLGIKCNKCVLKDKGWKNKLNSTTECLSIECATEEELDIALSLINQFGSSPESNTGNSPENGGNNMETPTITISLERYDELIKKEVLYDELTKGKQTNMYLYQDVNEPLKEDK